MARAVTAGDADVRHRALLKDRVRVHRGEPQVFGTQLAGQDDGSLIPFPMIDPPGVDARRAAWGSSRWPTTSSRSPYPDDPYRPGQGASPASSTLRTDRISRWRTRAAAVPTGPQAALMCV
ncbi:DUF6624 domain-containing protein [Streptomyces jumonjinensis]|uniref:DUF6624 domain-containing protein n=1 Tax=Streptomyces jumonjinensis TaxID=1945 RepID=UPI0033251A1A